MNLTTDRRRYLALLTEQLEHLDASCEGFDQGRQSECKRLASTARVVCRQTDNSTSLLTHLGAADDIAMVDSAPSAPGPLPAGSLYMSTGVVVIRGSTTGVDWMPRCRVEANYPYSDRPLAQWLYEMPAITPLFGEKPTRWDIVNWLANKDGGSHVGKLPQRYTNLLDPRAMGVTVSVNGLTLLGSPFPSAMRQIGEELRVSLRRHFADEL